jgi:uncharacterized metal-binding protein
VGTSGHKSRSDGANHARITIVLVPFALVLGACLFFIPAEIYFRIFFVGLGCLSGLVVGPDLDQDLTNFNRQIWYSIPVVGWCIGSFWSWFWFPYAYFSKHRGVSHTIWGSLMRITYLLIWTPIAYGILLLFSTVIISLAGGVVASVSFGVFLEAFIAFVVRSFWPLVLMSIGLFVSDMGHLARDFRGLTI